MRRQGGGGRVRLGSRARRSGSQEAGSPERGGSHKPPRAPARWPAEWEPHRATWLAWPHNPETWPGRLPEVVKTFVAIVRALAGREEVGILAGSDELAQRAREALAGGGLDPGRGIRFAPIATDDAWLRDTGPLVVHEAGSDACPRRRVALAFRFDNWGDKYPGGERDAAVAARLARALGLEVRQVARVLEGGALDGDGEGTLLVTESWLAARDRRPGARERFEAEMEARLGARRVVWLAAGLAGDDTDGHVDQVARFVAPGRVAVAAAGRGNPNRSVLLENRRRLRRARDARGRRLEAVELPLPGRLELDGVLLPASYLNFYLAEGVVLAPEFGVAEDAAAHAMLAELFPGREVAAIPARALAVGLGSIHCVTWQEPAPPSCPSASDTGG